MKDPSEQIEKGRAVLEPLLLRHGYSWKPGPHGTGSGGPFASGEYVRGNRRLELHFRHSLGLVTYHVGRCTLDQACYMRALLGAGGGNEYPGFPNEPLDAFRHLANDLQRYCAAFLEGTDAEFEAIARRATAEARLPGIKRLP